MELADMRYNGIFEISPFGRVEDKRVTVQVCQNDGNKVTVIDCNGFYLDMTPKDFERMRPQFISQSWEQLRTNPKQLS
jgi:hypothetical protein